MSTTTQSDSFDPKTKSIFITLGVLLIVGFIMPLYFREVVFANIEALGQERVPFEVKFQLLYPLLAGIGVLIIANQKRNLVTALLIILLALLPFMMLAGDADMNRFFSFGNEIGLNFDFISFAGILSFVAVLGGAYSSAFLKQRKIGTYITLGGVLIFALSLFIKGDMNQSIPLIDSLRMIVSPEDYYRLFQIGFNKGELVIRLMGVVMLASLLLKIFACYSAVLMFNEGEHFDRHRKRVLQNWISSILILLVSLFVVIGIAAADKGGEEAFIAVFLMMLKMLLWIGSLFAMLPLALSELLLLIDKGAKFDVPAPVAEAGKKFTSDVKETIGNVTKSPEIQTPPTVHQESKSEEKQPNQTIQKLTDLKKMFDQGLINQDEFDMVRKDILKKI